MARIIAIFPRQDQASGAIDTLKNYGFTRDKMIVSSFGPVEPTGAGVVADLQTEQDEIGVESPLANTIGGDTQGIVISMEVPKRDINQLRELLEQSGATDIRLE
ncbi:MAG: hypothetical protein GX062_08715 [Firmicutes bacterium]|mgnify:CR=1 FL=1|jgi:hypothetical protein|nr:hypothetical protein [Bacillota bacterium]